MFYVLGWGLAGLGAAAIVFPLIDRYNKTPDGAQSNAEIAAIVEAPAKQARQVPDHYYVWSNGNQFGYERELGESERRRGDAAAPLFVVSHSPNQGQPGYGFYSVDGGVTEIFNCTEPCAMVQSNGTRGPRVIPAPEGSLLWAVVEDMRHGHLGVIPSRRPPIVEGAPLALKIGSGDSTNASPAQQQPDAQRAPTTVTTPDLYAEYLTDPSAANEKYEGQQVAVKGKVVAANFNDSGIGHLRMVLTDGGVVGTTDSVVLCFTESCASVRYPTVMDDQFKAIKVGGFVRATCTVEPVKVVRAQEPKLVSVNLSKCSLP